MYRAILALDPGHSDALHLLAVALNQTGRQAEALERVAHAIRLNDGDAAFHQTRGNALIGLSRWADAATSYRRALALRPTFTEALNGLAVALMGLGNAEAAAATLGQAIALKPDDADAHYNLGNALGRLDRVRAAVAAYTTALRLKPDYVEALGNLGNLLRRHNRLPEAEACYRRALAIKPDFLIAESNLGAALSLLDRHEEAIALLARAIARPRSLPEAHCNYGVVLHETGQLEAAIRSFEQAIARKGSYAEAHSNRGVALLQLRRVDEAIAAFRQAMSDDPGYAKAHFHLAMALMMQGQFPEGLVEYEWRWAVRDSGSQKMTTRQPEWSGEDLTGRTILLYSEQGFGDTLQFCRFAPSVAARGGRVILSVQPQLCRLLRGLPGVAEVIGAGAAPPPFDLQAPLMSLPRILGMTIESIPASIPYLAPAPEAAERWRARLAALPGPKVGLVWAGDPRPQFRDANLIDRRRSLRLDQLAPLGAVEGVTFVNLQMGLPAEQLRMPPSGLGLVDWMVEIGDFADTAALVAGLDLVISADTSVAHLAGALGRPVWVMSRFDGCWRWLDGRDDSPWYPTLRLFRQRRPNDWDEVVRRVAQTLSARATGGI